MDQQKQTLESNSQTFEAKYQERNEKIINEVDKGKTIGEQFNILKNQLGKAIVKDEAELGRSITYAEMRMRYG